MDFRPKTAPEYPHRDLFTGREVLNGQPLLFQIITAVDGTYRHENVNKYISQLVGTLTSGEKVMVVLHDIPVFVDCPIEKSESTNQVMGAIKTELRESQLNYKSIEVIYGKPLLEFRENDCEFIRIHFHNLHDRWDVINYLRRTMRRETASDDIGRRKMEQGYYFNKYAREYKFNTAGWNVLTNYTTIVPTSPQFTANPGVIKYIFHTNIEHFKPSDANLKPKILVASWDIETATEGDYSGNIPKDTDTDWNIYIICLTIHWSTDETPLLAVHLSDTAVADRPSSPYPTYIIETPNERELLRAFILCLGRLAPDMLIAFNGGKFDHPMVREKLRRYELCCEFKAALSCMRPNNYTKNGVQCGDIESSIYNWSWKNELVKISAAQRDEMVCLDIPGILDIDVMVVFRKRYPASEVGNKYSLNFYLSINGLPSKDDLPYKEQAMCYKRARKYKFIKQAINGEVNEESNNLNSLSDEELLRTIDCIDEKIAECAITTRKCTDYCETDSFRTYQLFFKQNIITEAVELACMTFTDLYSSFYKADGMRVVNFVGARCHPNILFSNIVNDEQIRVKFPGAMVLEPKRGLNRTRPVAAVDAASLYPSIMMAFNTSPDASLEKTPDNIIVANDLIARGYDLYETEFSGVVTEQTSSQKGKLIKTAGWIIRHRGGQMAVFPRIQQELIARRVAMKKPLNALKLLLEKLLAGIDVTAADYNNTGATAATSLTELKYMYDNVNAKQLALKVLMNTFYGVQGNPKSAIYKLLVAGTITTIGQSVLALVKSKLTTNNYNVQYGDTDSNYVSSPEYIFEKVDSIYAAAQNGALTQTSISREEYLSQYKILTQKLQSKAISLDEFNNLNMAAWSQLCVGLAADQLKEAYWTQLVQITRRDIDQLIILINAALREFTSTDFIKMAYEEILFPTCFLKKKKYFGIPHIDNENFFPADDKYFVRGLDFIKQGQSGLAKIISKEIIKQACNIHNDDSHDMLSIVRSQIARIYQTEWPLDNFILTAKYKPDKKNVAVHTFVRRQQEKYDQYRQSGDAQNIELANLYKPPESGDPFQYIMVIKSAGHNSRGCKITLSKGDRMEAIAVYKHLQSSENPMIIDMNWYIESAIAGHLASFIAYYAGFNVGLEHKSYKEQDEKSTAAAFTYIMDICNSMAGCMTNKESSELGRKYRSLTRATLKQCRVMLSDQFGPAVGSFVDMLEISLTKTKIRQSTESIKLDAQQLSRDINPRQLAVPCMKLLKTSDSRQLTKLMAVYKPPAGSKSRIHPRLYTIDAAIKLVISSIENKLRDVELILQKFNTSIELFITENRDKDNAAINGMADVCNISSAEASCLAEFRSMTIKLAGLYAYREMFLEMCDLCAKEKAIQCKTKYTPTVDPAPIIESTSYANITTNFQ